MNPLYPTPRFGPDHLAPLEKRAAPKEPSLGPPTPEPTMIFEEIVELGKKECVVIQKPTWINVNEWIAWASDPRNSPANRARYAKKAQPMPQLKKLDGSAHQRALRRHKPFTE